MLPSTLLSAPHAAAPEPRGGDAGAQDYPCDDVIGGPGAELRGRGEKLIHDHVTGWSSPDLPTVFFDKIVEVQVCTDFRVNQAAP